MQHALVPSYFPAQSQDWGSLIHAATHTGVLAILNPDSGPGKTPDPAFQGVAARCTQGGVGLLGYVHTQYGKRPIADVVSEIDRFYQWYQVAGIFIDEVSTSEDTLVYFSTLHSYVKSKPAVPADNGAAAQSQSHRSTLACGHHARQPWVVINPGTSMPAAFLDVCDIAVTFENHCSQYAEWRPQQWEKRIQGSRFAHLVYGVTDDAEMLCVLEKSQKHGAGHVYVTSLTLPNPWMALPACEAWDQQVQKMKECKLHSGAGKNSLLRTMTAWLMGRRPDR